MMKKRLVLGALGIIIIVSAVSVAVTKKRDNNTTASNTTSSQQKTGSYVALGDSVAAGIGIGNYSDPSACNRTDASYPMRLAAKQNLELLSAACSGATTTNGILGSQTVNMLSIKPQIDTLPNNPPKLITITIGANDARWTQYLQQCFVGTCGSPEDTASLNQSITAVSTNIQIILKRITEKYTANPPKVVVTGYYQLYSPDAPESCIDRKGIDTNELVWIKGLQSSLNTAIENTVKASDKATFVPLDFEGHSLCSSDSWVQGIADKAPFHPNEKGQNAVADQIQKSLGKEAN